jgi:pimeloyl-ACP methyl ester carboxylesterase
MMKKILKIVILLSTISLMSCVSISRKPDLDLLYGASYLNENTVPIIIIPGLMGTTLNNSQGEELWPKSVSNLAFSTFEDLANEENDGIVPGKLLDGLFGIDFYGALLSTLEKAGHYEKGKLNVPVISKNKRRYYVFLYDWRKSNIDSVNHLHTLIEQIRLDYKDPSLKVDIIAHSNGGLIARYYLQYGPQTEQSRKIPVAWQDGEKRIRRIAMLGTPNLGSVISVSRLYQGFRFGLRSIPPHILTHFSTVFESLPSPASKAFMDSNGTPISLPIYDVKLWQANKWSIYSDESQQLQSKDTKNPEQIEQQLNMLFSKNLQRAFEFQSALAKPILQTKTQIALFGGDCELTKSKAIFIKSNNQSVIAFEESEVLNKNKNIDYMRLMNSPGDGLVTRESQLARASTAYLDTDLQKDLFPIAQTTFFCESHELLTGNPYFQNNLLYFLFH